ncbi:Hypothetical protein EPM1_0391 [Stenotrophomonas maltophilia EPM1]|nr:Hypothetical protein EPM1_0391 [Stenotrophomonas maltophilia EPM1]
MAPLYKVADQLGVGVNPRQRPWKGRGWPRRASVGCLGFTPTPVGHRYGDEGRAVAWGHGRPVLR